MQRILETEFGLGHLYEFAQIGANVAFKSAIIVYAGDRKIVLTQQCFQTIGKSSLAGDAKRIFHGSADPFFSRSLVIVVLRRIALLVCCSLVQPGRSDAAFKPQANLITVPQG